MSQNHSRRFSMDEIRKATGGFNESMILGEGGYGRVYKGVIDDESTPTLVAVKQTLEPESKQGIQGLETEIKMLAKCRHSNLVTLLGYCNENREMILVYEYMSGGNLADHLYGNTGAFLTWEQRLRICIGAARGLEYLHTGTGLSERIVHLDVKSDNILLDDNLAAKVADLGLSQVGPVNQQNTQVNTRTLRGTEGYVDPEYSRTLTYSSKSDVYSFGVVLLEVLTGRSVYRSKIILKSDLADWIQQYISKEILVQIVDPRIASTVRHGSLKSFVHTASNMLQLDSMKRPAMLSVVAQLESALELQISSPVVDDDDDDPNEVMYEGRTFRPNFAKSSEKTRQPKMSLFHERPCRRFSFDEIQKATDNFSESKIIGKGGFGNVYKGVVADGSTTTVVAVKRLTPESKQGIGEFETEIQMLSKSRHSNLVNLLGYCNENQEMILVYEYMSQGNLADHLYMNRGSSLTWEQRLKICIGAARGLDYLHTGTGLSDRIIHLDVKSANVLLDDNLAAKIADLGLSKTGPANQPHSEVNTANIRGTWGYVDPQFLKTHNYSRKADVYSFGVVLLEVLSGTSAWRDKIIPNPQLIDRADWIQQHLRNQTLNQIVDSRVVTQIQPKCLERFAYTASKSLQNDPKKRPSMSDVVALLESALTFQSSSKVEDDIFQFESEEETSSIQEYLGKAHNIFGEPIGNKTMLQMGLKPTRENKARVAYKIMKEGNKYDNALHFVKDLKAQWGNWITTLCMLYNATGETLTYAASHNWFGDIGPSPYPTIILNGQWGAYLHTKTPGVPRGSQAAVVYRGKYLDNAFCDRMITWSIPWQRFTHDNAAYCEINEVGHFDGSVWDTIYNKTPLAGRESSITWKDCYTRVTVKSDASPIYKAILMRVDAVATSV